MQVTVEFMDCMYNVNVTALYGQGYISCLTNDAFKITGNYKCLW